MTHPVFQDRYHALSYYRAALRKEDDLLQAAIQKHLKRMDELRVTITWNEQELKKEILEKRVREHTSPPQKNPSANSDFALTSFSRESGVLPGSLGLNSPVSTFEPEEDDE